MHRPAALEDTNKSYIFLDAGTACRTHVMTLKQLEILDVPQIKPGRKICLYNSHSEDCFCHFVQLIFEKNANMNHQKVTSSNGFPSLCCVFVEPFIHKSYGLFLPSKILGPTNVRVFHDLIGISEEVRHGDAELFSR